MPELPEVETTRRGISPHISGVKVVAVKVRQPSLRWPVTPNLDEKLVGQVIDSVERRAKYLLLMIPGKGVLIVHLGMSGCLRIVDSTLAVGKHDHVDIVFTGGKALRYTDPRRFGAMLWVEGNPTEHRLLQSLGPEPLSAEFNANYLYQQTRGKTAPVKQVIMDSRIVVGVGNIYANEALFAAGIAPKVAAGRIGKLRYQRLVEAIQQILKDAIKQGGTTLKDFLKSDGKPGYFRHQLKVYGRGGEACVNCSGVLKEIRLGQRSTVFCGRCQR